MSRSYLKVKDVAKQLKVAPTTVRKYTNEGRLEYGTNPSGQRVFTQEQVDKFLGKRSKPDVVVFYLRTSDSDPSGIKIENQLSLLTKLYGEPFKVYKDKASGLSEKRQGLQALLSKAEKGEFNILCITQKDRLTRFGYDYLEKLLSAYGVVIQVAGEDSSKSLQEELLQDFMSLIASFSGRFYRLRGYAQQKKLLTTAGVELEKKASKKNSL